jgi:hypothetical protein
MNQMAVAAVNVVAVAPAWGQGETDANPRPVPSATNSTVIDAATNAPAMIAAHETEDVGDSFDDELPATCPGPGFSKGSMAGAT